MDFQIIKLFDSFGIWFLNFSLKEETTSSQCKGEIPALLMQDLAFEGFFDLVWHLFCLGLLKPSFFHLVKS